MINHMYYRCPALARFVGFLGFMILGLSSLYWQINHFQLDPLHPGAGRVIIALVLGLIGLFFGQGLGYSFKIRNDKLAEFINSAWHYLANGSAIWMLLSMVALSLTLGKENMEILLSRENYLVITIFIAIIAAIGSELICLFIYLSGAIMLNISHGFGHFLSRILPIATGLVMGYIQFSGLGISIIGGLIIGFIFPFIFIPITASTRRRDAALRERWTHYELPDNEFIR